MGGWEKFKILVKKKKKKKERWRCRIINGGGDKSINQTVEKKGRKNKRNRKRNNGMYLGNLKSATSTTFLQYFHNKSQMVSCYWFKFIFSTKITFLTQQ